MKTLQEPISAQTNIEAIVHFFKSMDIEMIDAILDDKLTYQDLEKPLFLHHLQIAFEEFQSAGDTELVSYPGECQGCEINKGCKGFTFVGNHSRNFMDVIIKTEKEEVIDIFQCGKFTNYNSNFLKNKYVSIEKIGPPPG